MRLSTGHLISFAAGAAICAAMLRGGAAIESSSIDDGRQSPVVDTLHRDAVPFDVRALQQITEGNHANNVRRAEAIHHGAASLQPGQGTVECCLKVAEDIDTTMAKRLRDQQSQNPRMFEQQLQANGQRLMELCALRQNDPSLYSIKLQEMKVESQVLRVGRELCKATEENNEQIVIKLEDELRSALRTQLLYEIKARGDFLLALRERVDDMTTDLDKMANQFPQTVEQRLREMKACRDPNNPRWQPREVWEPGLESDAVIPPE